MDKEFLDKLSAVQMELKAPKGQYNSFGKYSYRSCEDILEAVKPLLSKNGLTLLLTDEPVAVGNRVYIKATARLIGGGDTIEVTAYAREPEDKKGMDTSQVTGTASSYARKYADHPRPCGEKYPRQKSHFQRFGSPPPMRGKVACIKIALLL